MPFSADALCKHISYLLQISSTATMRNTNTALLRGKMPEQWMLPNNEKPFNLEILFRCVASWEGTFNPVDSHEAFEVGAKHHDQKAGRREGSRESLAACLDGLKIS